MDSEEPIETIESRQQRLASVPRACEGCRIRKIRCDRTIPCSHCRSSGISCQNISDKPTSRSRSDRVKQLETHVSHLQRRLRTLEDRLIHSQATPETQRVSPKIEENAIEIRALSSEATDNHLYEGETSFTFQSLQASELIGRTIRSNAQGGVSNQEESLNDLENALQDMTPNEPHSLKFSIPRPIPSMKPLPTALVIGILRRCKARHPIFLSSFAVNDLDLVERLCRDVYFPVGKITVGQVTSMHGILLFLLREYKALDDPLTHEYDIDAQISQCEQNFVAGLETYDILAIPSFENILALVMGVLKAQEEGKPFLYCTLISSASTHCLALGYHRKETYQKMKTQDAENIGRLFWTVYVFDKNITLLLGRSPHIQVHDSGAKFPTVAIDPNLRPWDETFLLGAKLATIQGQIYYSFYSPASSERSLSRRLATINRLSEEMEKWKLEFDEINPYGMKNAQVFELSRGNWAITYYSTLTSLYRASPDPKVCTEISHQCFTAARRSLESHLQCFPKYQESGLLSDNEYFNFVLFFASFTPFIVTFLYAIGTNSLAEIELLEEVTSTLENVQQASESVKKLLKVCSTFVQLAKGLVQPEGWSVEFLDLHNGIVRCENRTQGCSWSRDLIQEAVEGDYTSEADARSVFNFLDDWIIRQPLPMDFFDMNLDMECEEETLP